MICDKSSRNSYLGLPEAYYCVAHAILLQRLDVASGLKDTVLQWIRSFLTGRTQHVAYCGRTSSMQPVLFGVPQGSVLGPLLYVLFTAELTEIVARHGLQLHLYADDCQVYLSTSVEHIPQAVGGFTTCVADVNACLTDYQQTTAECIKDFSNMARFESAARQGDVQRGPVTWDPRRDLRLCS